MGGVQSTKRTHVKVQVASCCVPAVLLDKEANGGHLHEFCGRGAIGRNREKVGYGARCSGNYFLNDSFEAKCKSVCNFLVANSILRVNRNESE